MTAYKYKVGDRVQPTDDRSNGQHSVGTVVGLRTYIYGQPTYRIQWDDLTCDPIEASEDFIRLVNAPPREVMSIHANGHHLFYTDKPEMVTELVEAGVLFHIKTVVFDDYVKYIYSNKDVGYCVEDRREQKTLWELYPQEK